MEKLRFSPGDDATAARRWCTPTPGKFVAAPRLLGVAFLYLSDQWDWFAFNKQKGWTVLIANTLVIVGFALIFVWLAGAYLLGRGFSSDCWQLLLMIPAVAIPVAWFDERNATGKGTR